MKGNGQNLRAELEGRPGNKESEYQRKTERKGWMQEEGAWKSQDQCFNERDLVLEASMWIGW